MKKNNAPSAGQGTHASKRVETIIARAYSRIKGTPHETDAAALSLPVGLLFVLVIDWAVKSWI